MSELWDEDKNWSICEKCGSKGVCCECVEDPLFNQMGRMTTTDLIDVQTVDGPIMMTMEQYVMVCNYTKSHVNVKQPLIMLTIDKVIKVLDCVEE